MITSVSFYIARLLKEKGFDNELSYYYDENGELLFDIDFPSLQPTKLDAYFSAPTIAEVVMWLYEKHGIWVEVYIDDDSSFGYLVSKITKEGRVDSPLKRLFNTPTEAYEAAIEYCLVNLTNKEEKK